MLEHSQAIKFCLNLLISPCIALSPARTTHDAGSDIVHGTLFAGRVLQDKAGNIISGCIFNRQSPLVLRSKPLERGINGSRWLYCCGTGW